MSWVNARNARVRRRWHRTHRSLRLRRLREVLAYQQSQQQPSPVAAKPVRAGGFVTRLAPLLLGWLGGWRKAQVST